MSASRNRRRILRSVWHIAAVDVFLSLFVTVAVRASKSAEAPLAATETHDPPAIVVSLDERGAYVDGAGPMPIREALARLEPGKAVALREAPTLAVKVQNEALAILLADHRRVSIEAPSP